MLHVGMVGFSLDHYIITIEFLGIPPSRAFRLSSCIMSSHSHDQDEMLTHFRNILTEEGLLHHGDTIGTDDSTLQWVNSMSCQDNVNSRLPAYSRFLRARKFNLRDAKKMFADCQEWRKTVESVGIDELYRSLDPFDVSIYWSMVMCSICSHVNSTLNARRSLRAGQCGFTRCAYSIRTYSCLYLNSPRYLP